MTTGTCGAKHPKTGAECVFGHGHAVGYHHGTDGANWPVMSGFPAPVAEPVVTVDMPESEEAIWRKEALAWAMKFGNYRRAIERELGVVGELDDILSEIKRLRALEHSGA